MAQESASLSGVAVGLGVSGGGSEVKQIDRNGQFRLHRQRHYITKALAGREVGLMEVEHRILVFYRRTLLCELDLQQPASISATATATPAAGV